MAKQIRFYTDTTLGPKQSLTPEGFLLCEDVPLARTGTFLAAEGEIPVEADKDHIVRIHRTEDEVFAPSSILSFAGKPIVDEHPPVKVTPDNWKQYAKGVMLNPRRGEGADMDPTCLYVDFLVQDKEAIQDVRTGKREVSAGYDAEYEQIRPGEGRQHNIIGNHGALVKRGRCGPRCTIGDNAMPAVASSRGPAWKDRIIRAYRTHDENTLVDELDKVGEMMGERWTGDAPLDDGQHHHITVNIGHPGGEKPVDDAAADPTGGGSPAAAAAAKPAPSSGGSAAGGAPSGSSEQTLQEILARLDAVEQAIAVLANGEEGEPEPTEPEPEPEDNGEEEPGGGGEKPPTGDSVTGEEPSDMTKPGMPGKPPAGSRPTGDRRRASVGDSTSMRAAYQDLMSKAELVVPGFRTPTFDSAKPARLTFDSMCATRKSVLAQAMKREDTYDTIVGILGSTKPNFSTMSCDAAAVVFNSTAEVMRQRTSSNLRPRGMTNDLDVLRHATGEMRQTVASINEKNRQFYANGGRSK